MKGQHKKLPKGFYPNTGGPNRAEIRATPGKKINCRKGDRVIALGTGKVTRRRQYIENKLIVHYDD